MLMIIIKIIEYILCNLKTGPLAHLYTNENVEMGVGRHRYKWERIHSSMIERSIERSLTMMLTMMMMMMMMIMIMIIIDNYNTIIESFYVVIVCRNSYIINKY